MLCPRTARSICCKPSDSVMRNFRNVNVASQAKPSSVNKCLLTRRCHAPRCTAVLRCTIARCGTSRRAALCHRAPHYAPRCTAVHPDAPQYTTVHRGAPQYATMHRSAPQYATMHRGAPQYATVHRASRCAIDLAAVPPTRLSRASVSWPNIGARSAQLLTTATADNVIYQHEKPECVCQLRLSTVPPSIIDVAEL